MIMVKAVGTNNAAPNSKAARQAKPATKPSPQRPKISALNKSARPPSACMRAVTALARAQARGIAGARIGMRDNCQRLPPTAAAAPR